MWRGVRQRVDRGLQVLAPRQGVKAHGNGAAGPAAEGEARGSVPPSAWRRRDNMIFEAVNPGGS